jgi:hypothetical protein
MVSYAALYNSAQEHGGLSKVRFDVRLNARAPHAVPSRTLIGMQDASNQCDAMCCCRRMAGAKWTR